MVTTVSKTKITIHFAVVYPNYKKLYETWQVTRSLKWNLYRPCRIRYMNAFIRFSNICTSSNISIKTFNCSISIWFDAMWMRSVTLVTWCSIGNLKFFVSKVRTINIARKYLCDAREKMLRIIYFRLVRSCFMHKFRKKNGYSPVFRWKNISFVWHGFFFLFSVHSILLFKLNFENKVCNVIKY